jgi:predicted Zn-dependent peptidase
MKFKKTTLPNGLRVITVPMKDSPAVMVLVMVETGSNYEAKRESGLSHFLEHMCFKGTKNRPKTSDIARELDALGAENNAFTGNEYTGYYAKAAKRHFPKLFEIISDLYLNPLLPAEDLEKERGVILQEISMYEDLPQRKVEEVLAELLYGDSPFGRSIAGSKENIKKLSLSDFINYRNRHYIADKTMVIVAGDVNESQVKRETLKYFKNIAKGKKLPRPIPKEIQKAPALKIQYKKTDQTHMLMAFRMFGANDKRIPAVGILSTILGKGMSSRLFHRLRSEMGACYYVSATADSFGDYGMFTIATGVEARRAEEVLKVLVDECKKLRDEKVSNQELDKAKESYIGKLYLGLETSDALASFYAEQEIKTKKAKTPQEVEKEIRKITAEDIMKVAKDIFRDDKLNLAIIGDIVDQKGLEKALSVK